MKYRALRGVCIGVERHLKVDDIADLDPATGKFLVSIKAVEEVKDLPSPPAAEPTSEATPAVDPAKAPDPQAEPDQKSAPVKSGKKEK